jgi:hypothetical protein
MQPVTSVLTCSQTNFYTVTGLCWDSCEEHIAKMAAYKPIYTPAYILTRRAELDAAMALPDFQTRTADAENALAHLKQMLPGAIDMFNKLIGYIKGVFDAPFRKVQNEAAGSLHKPKASNSNWGALKSMQKMSNEYLVTNLVTLTGTNNMPATFPVEYADYSKDCQNYYDTHLAATKDSEAATQTKNLANNSVHANLINMLDDAHLAITDNPAVLKQFTFSDVLALVDPSTSAGIKGTVTSATTGLPIPTVALTIINPATSATTDDEGKYAITQMSTGSNTLIAQAPGFTTANTPFVVKSGTTSTFNILMTPL